MTKRELEAKVRELEARVALLEAQKPQQVMVPVPNHPQPYWVPYITWKTAPDVDLTRGASVLAAEGALNTKTYTFG